MNSHDTVLFAVVLAATILILLVSLLWHEFAEIRKEIKKANECIELMDRAIRKLKED